VGIDCRSVRVRYDSERQVHDPVKDWSGDEPWSKCCWESAGRVYHDVGSTGVPGPSLRIGKHRQQLYVCVLTLELALVLFHCESQCKESRAVEYRSYFLRWTSLAVQVETVDQSYCSSLM
jgi:hypothetical protein